MPLRSFRVPAAAMLGVLCATGVLRAQKGKEQKPDAAALAQQQEAQTVIKLADAAMAGQPAPADFTIQFQNDVLRAQGGRVWVPVTLTIDPAKLTGTSYAMHVRVANKGTTAPPPVAETKPNDRNRKDGRKNDRNGASPEASGPEYPFVDTEMVELKAAAPGQPIHLQRGFAVSPGAYDVYVALHERVPAGATPKASVLKQSLDVPNYSNGELATSSVILADRVDQLQTPATPEQLVERPYAFGQSEIIVSPDRRFKKSAELIVLLQIYNPMLGPDRKFSLEAAYTFYRQEAGGEKRFNATEPQTFTPETMGAGFDPSGNAAIQAGQGIPLQSFPEGNYRLEIKITDKLSTKVLTQSANFTVTPS